MANAKRDSNYIPVLLGVTDDANLTPTQLIVDPTTKRLKVSAIISSGGGLTSLTGITAGSQSLITGTAGTDFNIVAGTYHIFNIPDASASNRGLLKSADWTTFNNKYGSGANTTLGTLTLNNVVGSAVLLSDGNGLIGKAIIGNSLSLSGVTLDAIQDLRTSASPTFVSPIFTGTLTINSVKGTAIGTDIQAFDADLTALAALSGTGYAARTAANTWALRNFTAGTNIGISQGDGVSGNTTIGVATAPTFAGLVTANLGLTTKGTILAELHKGTAFVFNGEIQNGNSGTNFTVNWTLGNRQALILNANSTLTFTAPEGACNLILKLTQNDGGAYTVTWPAAVKISGGTAFTSGTNKVDIATFYYSPTSGSYYTMLSTNF